MGKEEKFAYANSTINIPRSKFKLNHRWQASVFHGDLVPVEIKEVMPGESLTYKLNALTRTATAPIAPIMDNIYQCWSAFFVPKRLIWDKTKEFYGENKEGYGVQSEILEPRALPTGTSNLISIHKDAVSTYARSFGAYLGLVRQEADQGTKGTAIAVNPIRAYLEVYNQWFRNENFMAPYLWDHSQVGDGSRSFGVLDGFNVYANTNVPKVCKKMDRFTSCLPWAQKSNSAVLLPLGDSAPVFGDGRSLVLTDGTQLASLAKFGANNSSVLDVGTGLVGSAITGTGLSTSEKRLGVPAKGEVLDSGLVADLSSATAATINQLRMAFATQRYFEQLARTGSRYREYIKGMYGVSIGDVTAVIPEYLGGISYPINVAQVLQTTGYSAGQQSTLGAPGANSVTPASDTLFSKSFTEPGYLVIVTYMKHDRTYGQGLGDMWRKHEIWDYYNPKFAHIGEQAIKKSTLYFTGKADDDEAEFGFQEAWSDSRYIPDRVVGLLAPSNTNSYNFWNLAENFAAAPSLNTDFLTEDRNSIVRALAGGTASPDYFVDAFFDVTCVAPMPLFSIPGLIDHL